MTTRHTMDSEHTSRLRSSEESAIKAWKAPSHLRLRIEPRYSDVEYPHLADLNEFMRANGSTAPLTLLDYGAGAAPYRLYFPNSDYRTADVFNVPGRRYEIGDDGRIGEQDEVFDLVISTQVLEHVADAGACLRESCRLLKRGGTLLVTTHGTWEEHGVPYDFQRWTTEGLTRDLKAAGFAEVTIYKLTCGFRASLLLFIKGLFNVKAPRHLAARLAFKSFRYPISRIFPLLYRLTERYLPNETVVRAGGAEPSAAFYITIAAIARKE